MVTKIYRGARLFAYIACFCGVFYYLFHQADAQADARNLGLGIVGAGFVAFFISYALRAWLRLGPNRISRGE